MTMKNKKMKTLSQAVNELKAGNLYLSVENDSNNDCAEVFYFLAMHAHMFLKGGITFPMMGVYYFYEEENVLKPFSSPNTEELFNSGKLINAYNFMLLIDQYGSSTIYPLDIVTAYDEKEYVYCFYYRNLHHCIPREKFEKDIDNISANFKFSKLHIVNKKIITDIWSTKIKK